MITFVTGIYGAGKTTLAKSMGGRYVDYDAVHDYTNPGYSPLPFLAGLEDGDVVDAIPFSPSSGWDEFMAWRSGRDDVRVVAAQLSREEWGRRVGDRADDAEWCRLWVRVFGEFAEVEVGEVDLRAALSGYVTQHPIPHHDAKYQDLPEIGLVGYSESHRSWSVIEPLVDWAGRSVVDAGANHGYFALRALEAGASSATGLDQSTPALQVARCAARLADSPADFRRWSAGMPVPESDVMLSLNAVHHFRGKAESFVAATPAPLAIYEADAHWRDVLTRRYRRVEDFQSHRPGRLVFRCEV